MKHRGVSAASGRTRRCRTVLWVVECRWGAELLCCRGRGFVGESLVWVSACQETGYVLGEPTSQGRGGGSLAFAVPDAVTAKPRMQRRDGGEQDWFGVWCQPLRRLGVELEAAGHARCGPLCPAELARLMCQLLWGLLDFTDLNCPGHFPAPLRLASGRGGLLWRAAACLARSAPRCCCARALWARWDPHLLSDGAVPFCLL